MTQPLCRFCLSALDFKVYNGLLFLCYLSVVSSVLRLLCIDVDGRGGYTVFYSMSATGLVLRRRKFAKCVSFCTICVITSCLSFYKFAHSAESYRIVGRGGNKLKSKRYVPEYNKLMMEQQSSSGGKSGGRVVEDSSGDKYYTTGRVESETRVVKGAKSKNDVALEVKNNDVALTAEQSDIGTTVYEKSSKTADGGRRSKRKYGSKKHSDVLQTDVGGLHSGAGYAAGIAVGIVADAQDASGDGVGSSKVETMPTVNHQPIDSASKAKNAASDYYIEVARFYEKQQADQVAQSVGSVLNMPLESMFDESIRMHAVRIGPLYDKKDAEVMVEALASEGYNRVRIVQSGAGS